MAYHYNYEGALVGSIIGMMVAFLANEILAKFD
jgi:glucose-6-phosphate-specific signal transduction histidine kinase